MFHKFHRKTPVLESLFDKAAGLKTRKFIKKRPQHRCFPVKFGTFLKTSILKNICEQLLLYTVGTWRDFWVEDDSHPTDFYRTICLLYVHQIFIMFLSYIFILPFLSFFYHIFLSYLSINFSVFLFYQRESF